MARHDDNVPTTVRFSRVDLRALDKLRRVSSGSLPGRETRSDVLRRLVRASYEKVSNVQQPAPNSLHAQKRQPGDI